MQIVYSLHEIDSIAKEILKVSSGKTLLFYGEMGSGKTTLIKSLVAALGSTDRVSSPTFGLVNEYHTPNEKVFHFDFYRLEDEEEAYDIGFEEYFIENDWVFIEWPEKIPHLLPENAIKLDFKKINSTKRKITITDK